MSARIDPPTRVRRKLRRVCGLAVASAAIVALAGCKPVPGALDTTFGDEGVAVYQDATGEARASVQQPDGKTVVAGHGYHPDGSPSLRAVYVARYDTAGRPDPTFANSMAKIDVARGGEVVRRVVVDGQGRIVVLGNIPAPDYPDETEVFVLRLTPTGQLDTTFDGDGILLIDRSNHDRAGDVAVQGSRLLVAASFDSGGSWANQWTLLALNETGGLDTGFSGDGIAAVPTNMVSEFDRLRSIVLQGNGRILLGGSANGEFVAVRLLADGDLDTSWDGDGVARALVGTGGEAYNTMVQPDGKVVLAGYARPGGARPDEDMAAVRWTSAGALDASFDGDGKVLVDFGIQDNDRSYGAALDVDGKVVMGGFAYTTTGMDLAVARLDTNGTPDPSFSADGRATTNFGETANEQIESITIASNAGNPRVLAAGWYHDRWLLAAYHGGVPAA